MLLALVTVAAYFHPFFVPDVAGYAATVMSADEHDGQVVYDSVVRQVMAELGPEAYRSSLADPTSWVHVILSDREALLEQMPFYANRPLFVAAARALVRHTPLDAFHALYLISAFCVI
ncbi:MAG: hypothetical protein WAL85_19955, partial [Candidatus Korobacteraceae bacterium]